MIDLAMILCYNLAILAGTAALVQFYDWNPWWFLLAVSLMMSLKKTNKEEE